MGKPQDHHAKASNDLALAELSFTGGTDYQPAPSNTQFFMMLKVSFNCYYAGFTPDMEDKEKKREISCSQWKEFPNYHVPL